MPTSTCTKRIKDDIDSQAGPHANISFKDLCIVACNKYLNMEVEQEYNVVDLKDSRIMALTTKLEALEEKVAKYANTTSGYTQPRSGNSNSNSMENIKRMPKWSTIKKDISVTQKRETWHRCKYHIGPERAWSGLYSKHKEKDHDLHMTRFKNRCSKFETNDGEKGSNGSGDKLVISQHIKEDLCSKFMLNNKDAEQ